MLYVPNQAQPQFKHQSDDLERMWDKPGFGWWWEQGTGKSREFIDNMGMLYGERMIGGGFMLAPNGLHRNFITQQCEAHIPSAMKENTRTLFWHQDKAKTKAWQNKAREFMSWKGLKVLSMSYDGICTDLGKKLAKEFLTSTRVIYGADESQRIANPAAWRTTVVLASGPYAPFRRVMTGTPVANAPWDVWSQIKFVDEKFWLQYGLDAIETMKAQFGEWDQGARRVPIGQAKRGASLQAFYDKQGTPPELRTSYKTDPKSGTAFMLFPKIATAEDGRPLYKNLNKLREIIAPIRSRVLKKDVFDLPPKIHTPLEFDMSPAQARAYKSMQDMGFVLTEGGETCSASIALTVMLRLQQIACGYLVTDIDANRDPNDDEPRVQPITPNPRLELLSEITADLNHPALIWARFTPDVDAICDMLKKQGKTVARYDGVISDDECAENEARFHRGDAQFFVSKASKGGEGLTLIEAQTAIFYSYSYKLIEYLQASDRPHRWGQKSSVNEIMFKARGTIDERTVYSLQAKMDMSAGVTGDALRNWLVPLPSQYTLNLN